MPGGTCQNAAAHSHRFGPAAEDEFRKEAREAQRMAAAAAWEAAKADARANIVRTLFYPPVCYPGVSFWPFTLPLCVTHWPGL